MEEKKNTTTARINTIPRNELIYTPRARKGETTRRGDIIMDRAPLGSAFGYYCVRAVKNGFPKQISGWKGRLD